MSDMHDLRIFGVSTDITDNSVTVDLYGGPTNAFGSVKYVCETAEFMLKHWSRINRLMLSDVPVTLVEKTKDTEPVLRPTPVKYLQDNDEYLI